MRLYRRIVFLIFFLTVAAGVWGAIYVQKQGFPETLRTRIEDEFAKFAKREVYIKIDQVTLGPFQGLVAEDVFFYLDPERKQELAFIDNMILDLNLTEVLDRDLTINSLDVKDARLDLPLTPGKRESEMLSIKHFSGRVVVTENQIEIVKAEGELEGIEITLKGSLHRPPEVPGQEISEAPDPAAQRRELREMGRWIDRLKTILQELEHFRFNPNKPPRLDIAFSGDLDNLAGLRGSARLTAEDFSRDSYAVEMLTASLEFDGVKGMATLKELHLRDPKGDLRLWAEWQTDGNEAIFDLETTANLPLLASTLFPDPRLREVQFFDEPPRLKMEGKVDLNRIQNFEFPDLPLEAIGEFRCNLMGSRGEVFHGLEFNFSIDDNRYYVRNLQLDHRSGTLLANLMYDPSLEEKTFRFQSEVKFDLRTVAPFLQNDELQRFFNRWSFDRESTVYIATIGSGPDFDPYRWNSQGVIDLRNFRLNNVPFDHLEAEYETRDHQQVFRNLKLARPEGEMNVDEAIHDSADNRWEIATATSNLDLIQSARAFFPPLAGRLKPFRFEKTPEITLSGTLDSRTLDERKEETRSHDFQVEFRSTGGAETEIFNRTLSFDNPEGILKVDPAGIHLTTFSAGAFGGEFQAEYRANDPENADDFTARLELEKGSVESFGRLFGETAEGILGDWSGQMDISGRRGADPQTFTGNGSVSANRIELFAIPLFASLPTLTPEWTPNSPVAADSARAKFRLADGNIQIGTLTAEAAGFRFTADGDIGLTDRKILFDAALEIPDTDGYRFSGTGSFNEPVWTREKRKKPAKNELSGPVPAEKPAE